MGTPLSAHRFRTRRSPPSEGNGLAATTSQESTRSGTTATSSPPPSPSAAAPGPSNATSSANAQSDSPTSPTSTQARRKSTATDPQLNEQFEAGGGASWKLAGIGARPAPARRGGATGQGRRDRHNSFPHPSQSTRGIDATRRSTVRLMIACRLHILPAQTISRGTPGRI